MTKVTIMLACAAGMSTSLLVTKMQAAADEKALDAEIFAVPAPEVDDILSEKKVDVLLLGPQVRYLLDQFTEKLAQKNIPVGVIPMVDYGMMNGPQVLALAEELIGG
ncbi:PTS sugar transporter subunit IIB [Streptococcus constellatus]|uniref:PTS sugar transporter subunit IIB n=1 Tax=Streptococcus constellatus TaxID=76860 RepID=UPI0020006372|nr:PTS sugar transporter subunit IIB [Streptococcus constellatus]